MRQRLVLASALGILVLTLGTGCLFNVFQTARTVGAGSLALTLGAGIFTMDTAETPIVYATPQARLTLGLARGVDLGLQSGVMVAMPDGDPGWLGLIGDVKFRLFDDPDLLTLSFGLGGGHSVEFVVVGWGVFGEIFFDSNLRAFPIFLAYQPGIPLNGDSFVVLHHLAGGLRMRLSDQTRLLLEADYRTGVLSFGLALEVGF